MAQQRVQQVALVGRQLCRTPAGPGEQHGRVLSRLGRSTLLFDGDLGLANVDVQIGLKPARDLGGVISGRTSLKGALVSVPGCGFDVSSMVQSSAPVGSVRPSLATIFAIRPSAVALTSESALSVETTTIGCWRVT